MGNLQDQNVISWGGLVDRHVVGNTAIGRIWIRVGRDFMVTGVYTLFGNTRKYVPKPNETWKVKDAKVIAELALEDELAFREKFNITHNGICSNSSS